MKSMHMISRIRLADSHTLLHIRNTELPHFIGITDAERSLIRDEIDRRFGQLNQQAIGNRKPRWDV